MIEIQIKKMIAKIAFSILFMEAVHAIMKIIRMPLTSRRHVNDVESQYDVDIFI